MSSTSQALVAPSDIAEMASVSRGAVSNWRRRADDFPEAVGGTAAKPLFPREAVHAWLVTRGYDIQKDSGEANIWSAMNALRGFLPAGAMADLILTLACARKLSDESPSVYPPWMQIKGGVNSEGFAVLAGVAESEEDWDPRWSTLVDSQDAYADIDSSAATAVVKALDSVDPADLATVTDYVLAKCARAQVRSGLDHGFVESRISEALGNLAAAHSGDVLYDPACGTGTAILNAIDAGLAPQRVVGHDIDFGAVRQAAQRAYLRGVDIELLQGDVLAHDLDEDLRADIVIAEPPLGLSPQSVDVADPRWQYGLPGPKFSELAWIQHVVAHLTDHGRGFVVTPLGVLFREGSEKPVRTELVRRGCVESITVLPPRMLPHIGMSLAVWVVRAPADQDRSEILFIDASKVEDVEKRIGHWSPTSDGIDMDVPHQHVDIRDVLAAGAHLSPVRWIEVAGRTPTEVADSYHQSSTDLNQTVEDIDGIANLLKNFVGTSHSRLFTIGELIDQGLLEMRPGRARVPDLSDELRHLCVTPSVIARGHLPLADETIKVPSSLATDLTGVGDVLVTTQGTISATIDNEGGHLLGQGTYRLRSTDGSLHPGYLALVIAGSWNNRFLAETAIPRANIRLLEIPLVPKAEQSRAQVLDSAILELVDQAHALLTHAASVREAMRDALRYNITLPSDE
ncbi:N-6 DNA methylase [Nocardia sp. 348MFTsu5.1]|uniref:N-6 DNA methylase n=1 Tax=Nocardia sp. 348MFTsu5.1 TaxID=1172185 RepID=UPI0012DF96E2|nr:N-6 DNA methylase [Nocardia sp. 348MFTsu5.1]